MTSHLKGIKSLIYISKFVDIHNFADQLSVTEDNRIQFKRIKYNKVIDYIEFNLEKSLSLQELADVAYFSPFHFYRKIGRLIKEKIT